MVSAVRGLDQLRVSLHMDEYGLDGTSGWIS